MTRDELILAGWVPPSDAKAQRKALEGLLGGVDSALPHLPLPLAHTLRRWCAVCRTLILEGVGKRA